MAIDFTPEPTMSLPSSAPNAGAINFTPDSASTPATGGEAGTGPEKALLSAAQYPAKVAMNVAASPVQLLAKAIGRPDPYANGIQPFQAVQGAPSLTNYSSDISPATPAGFLVKAGQLGNLASMAVAPELSGVKAMAGLGAASGISNSLAAGNTDPHQLVKDTIWGTLFGTGLGVFGSALGGLAGQEAARTGVVGATQDAVQNTHPDLLSKYINAAKDHGETMASLSNPTPVGIMENEFKNRIETLTSKVIPQAGKALGAARDAYGSQQLTWNIPGGSPLIGKDAVGELYNEINTTVQSMTRHGFGTIQDAEESLPGLVGSKGPSTPALYQLPGREVQLTKTESDQLQNLQGYLERLKQKPTIGAASDLLVNINRDIGSFKNSPLGEGNSPVEGALKRAAGLISDTIKNSSPEVAQATQTYADLMNLKDQLGSQAGKDAQNGALMMRRVISGDKSNSVVPVLNQLDAATAALRPGDKTTLVQHALLGRWSTEMFGDTSTKGLLAQAVGEGNKIANNAASIIGWPKQFVRNQIENILGAISPDPAGYAMSVAKGDPYSMNPIVRLLDKEVEFASKSPLLQSISASLKSFGVTAHNLEPIAKQILKVYLLQKLTQPKPDGFPNQQSPGLQNTFVPPAQPATQPVSQAPQGRSLSAGVNTATDTAMRGLTAPDSGAAMSAGLRTGLNPGGNLSSPSFSLS